LTKEIQPYKFISGHIDLPQKSCQVAFSKAKFIMNTIESLAITQSNMEATEKISMMSKVKSDEIFEEVFETIHRKFPIERQKTRLSEHSYITYYALIKKYL
jgi:hypothetical protein